MKKGEFLLNIRKKHKASRAKFAELLEVSPSTIEKTEKELVPITPENKYVKAVCALEGLDNEIFKFDEITDEILREYELTKFSKAFRKFLYFYYGDFWNEDITDILIPEIKETFIKYALYGKDDSTLLLLIDSEDIKKLIQQHISNLNRNCMTIFQEILIILTLYNKYKAKFKVSCFTNNLKEYYDFLKEEKIKKENINCIEKELKNRDFLGFEDIYIINLKTEKMKKDLADLEDIGLPLTIENIKKLKKQKELEKIKDEVIPAPTDPKDKQICELLQYAPPAFKDKIIEKLLKFKDEVEDI